MTAVSARDMAGRMSETSSSDILIPDGEVYDYSFQIYDFDLENGGHFKEYWCELDGPVNLRDDPSNYLVLSNLNIASNTVGYSPAMQIKVAGLDKALASLSNQCDTYENGEMDLTASLTLDNGETFYFDASFSDARIDNIRGSADVGGGFLNLYFIHWSSNMKPASGMGDYQKVGYLSQQLRTYNIRSLQMGNFSVRFEKFPTAATISSMFNTLAEKTGMDLFHYTDTVTDRTEGSYSDIDSAVTSTPAKAAFLSITTEHNVYQDGRKGMNVVVSFNVSGMKGKSGEISAYFYFKSGNPLKDFNNNYYTPGGNVVAPARYSPSYDDSTYTDFRIFIPLDELHMAEGTHELKAQAVIFDENGKKLAVSDWTYFNYY